MGSSRTFSTLRNPLYLAAAAAATLLSVIAYFQWDEPVARFFFGQTNPRIDESAEWISDLGTIIRPELAFIVWLIFRKRNPRWATAALFFVAAVAGAGLVNVMLKFTLGRCRPEMLFEEGMYGLQWFQIEAKYWSLPSGHTASAMAAMMTLTLLFPRVGPLFLIHAALMGYSRVALMQHYISDVLMGGVVGAGVALAIYDAHFRAALERVTWWREGRRGIFRRRTKPGDAGASDAPPA